MKIDIKEEPSLTSKDIIWYSWNEYCDVCGHLVHSSNLKYTNPPDKNKPDYCIVCLRKQYDSTQTIGLNKLKS